MAVAVVLPTSFPPQYGILSTKEELSMSAEPMQANGLFLSRESVISSEVGLMGSCV